ncbi:hypothetical protein BBI01_09155 [Chryseobacterium artocarpi]|uniref:Uncharacterized protein n=1 Tax=Chryseobacterium artocarpi TaxID=1414727 RepID=A0A1B8ZL54_9FLAO|nr:hypothetical protein [Chryseobacterium artocarpi]OCA72294.1 hypothetical protein BBI01_09155 [Chryseobacterium artocarpi]
MNLENDIIRYKYRLIQSIKLLALDFYIQKEIYKQKVDFEIDIRFDVLMNYMSDYELVPQIFRENLVSKKQYNSLKILNELCESYIIKEYDDLKEYKN